MRLNGVDARDLQQSTVRDVTAVVPQDTLLFNGTVLDNIEYGRPGSSREAVEAAAKAAQLHDAIMRMPQGYDTGE